VTSSMTSRADMVTQLTQCVFTACTDFERQLQVGLSLLTAVATVVDNVSSTATHTLHRRVHKGIVFATMGGWGRFGVNAQMSGDFAFFLQLCATICFLTLLTPLVAISPSSEHVITET